jgi:hypothetical protein
MLKFAKFDFFNFFYHFLKCFLPTTFVNTHTGKIWGHMGIFGKNELIH